MAAQRIGKLRDSAHGRGWRAKLYGPTDDYGHHRIKFKDTATGQWVDRAVPHGADPDEYFDRLEAQLTNAVTQFAPRSAAQPTMAELCQRYIAWLDDTTTDAYVRKVKNLLDVWVLRNDAALVVQRWGPEDSNRWISAARAAGLSPARVEDLGVALAGLRKTAQRPHRGTRWIDRSEDPLEGVSYSKRQTEEGAHCSWVPPTSRPLTDHVESLLAVARTSSRWAWTAIQIAIGAYCGLRLSEQLALRALDVDLVRRELRVRLSVSWAVPTKAKPMQLGPTKTGRARSVPYPQSLHESLLAMCRSALGLPEDATADDVTLAQQACYDHHVAALDDQVARARRPRPISVHDHLLFIDPQTGMPPTKEKYGDEFRSLRARSTWPTAIPWRNARHHAAMWWRRISSHGGRPSVEWSVIASWLGNSETTCRNHYVRVGEDQLDEMRSVLDQH